MGECRSVEIARILGAQTSSLTTYKHGKIVIIFRLDDHHTSYVSGRDFQSLSPCGLNYSSCLHVYSLLHIGPREGPHRSNKEIWLPDNPTLGQTDRKAG